MTGIISLADLRAQIDQIDSKILELINQRAQCAVEVAKTKQAAGETGSFYRPDREALVLRRIKELNSGPLSAETTAVLFREIMSACLALEKPLDVGFLRAGRNFYSTSDAKAFWSCC